MAEPTREQDPRSYWVRRLHEFLPGFLEWHPVLTKVHRRASAILHGSTTWGVDDEWSDVDVWLLLPEADLREVAVSCDTRFFEFTLDGKAGHLNAESSEAFTESVHACHMDRIYQLRRAEVIADGPGVATELVAEARRPP